MLDLAMISPVLVDGREAMALTQCPGRTVPFDEAADTIAHWSPTMVLTLVEEQEIEGGTERLRRALADHHIAWWHFPIQNYGAPTAEDGWALLRKELHPILDSGRLLVHCWGGLGRSGMVAARLLVERGMAPEVAIAHVRAARPGAVETAGQEEWVEKGMSCRS